MTRIDDIIDWFFLATPKCDFYRNRWMSGDCWTKLIHQTVDILASLVFDPREFNQAMTKHHKIKMHHIESDDLNKIGIYKHLFFQGGKRV